MRLTDLTDWFVLRRHLSRPWDFLRLRKVAPAGPYSDVPMRDGGAVRVRSVPMDRHIFHRIFARDEYRMNGVAPGSWDTVIDVGAHAGFFAVRAAPLARQVLSYEPAPDNFELLAHNVRRFPNVKPFQAAVGGKPGTLTLHLTANPAAYSAMAVTDGSAARSIDVPCVTLEEIFRKHSVQRCDLMKLNCEGVEYETLYALPRERWGQIERLIVQYHPIPDAPADWTGAALAKYLEGAGHRVELRPSRKHAGKGSIFSTRAGGRRTST